MTMTDLNKIRARSFRFRDLDTARRFRDHSSTEVRLLVHGCDGYVWAVLPADAARLQRAGYEVTK